MTNFTKDLAQTQNNEQRTVIIERLNTTELKTFAENEFIPVNKRLGKNKLIAEIVKILADRFNKIDAGKDLIIFIGAKLTPLITARYIKNGRTFGLTP